MRGEKNEGEYNNHKNWGCMALSDPLTGADILDMDLPVKLLLALSFMECHTHCQDIFYTTVSDQGTHFTAEEKCSHGTMAEWRRKITQPLDVWHDCFPEMNTVSFRTLCLLALRKGCEQKLVPSCGL